VECHAFGCDFTGELSMGRMLTRTLVGAVLVASAACESALHPLEVDDDGDGFSELEGDCDDADPEVVYCPVTHAAGGTMIGILGGTFEMGCTSAEADCAEDEFPVHSVTLSHSFYIGETELTQGEYARAMGGNPSAFTDCGSDCPVEQITWSGAALLFNALSAEDGLTPCFQCDDTHCLALGSPLSCSGYRFPTEAEWAYAARCGDEFNFFNGTVDPDSVAWTANNSGGTPHPVGSLSPNACGLYDMIGNVWEWTWDWYGNYPSEAVSDPTGPVEGEERVMRGSSWDGALAYTRLSNRSRTKPADPLHILGLRLTRTITIP
jgi:formylglycine-generating enzyme required for sulfatase activity